MSDLERSIDRRAHARVGQLLRGKWHLDRLLGIGGMASVYAATHRNGKRGAVKLLHPELAMSATARARFLREGYVANKVGHPGAVSVLDDDETDQESVFLVMELLEGLTVESVAASRPNGVLGLDEALEIADQVLDVLIAAHENGIVHRDLKPENLFLSEAGTVHILDFGIARLRQTDDSVTKTRTGDAMGTPVFMPPEQALGDWDAVDGRSDLWALGATLFTLVSGHFVHEEGTVQKTMLAAMTKPAPPLASVLDGVSSEVAEIIDTALQMNRDDRWADARTMQAKVREALGTAPRVALRGQALKVSGTTDTLQSAVLDDPARATEETKAAPARPNALLLTAAPVSSDKGSASRTRSVWLFAAGFTTMGALGIAAAAHFATASSNDAPSSSAKIATSVERHAAATPLPSSSTDEEARQPSAEVSPGPSAGSPSPAPSSIVSVDRTSSVRIKPMAPPGAAVAPSPSTAGSAQPPVPTFRGRF